MYISKKWCFHKTDDSIIQHISEKFNISPIISKILINRGITSDNQISEFLTTDCNQFLNPFLLQDMDKAVKCIKQSISAGERITVYGDYDVDGITSTYILYDYLKSLGANVSFYIPDRGSEGYGLNIEAIDSLGESGTKLIITVDVGITALAEVEYAHSKNIKIVVTDHHSPMETIPDADAVINPKQLNNVYPNANLAGVGVAFKLVYALSECSKEILDKYCEFACIGTIADMVPLTGENRFIASYGLKKLPTTQNFGLKALMEVSSIDTNDITSSSISFNLAPRLNAAGRIASAVTSVNLMLASSYKEAIKLATYLDNGNRKRQQEEQKIFDEAIEIIEKHNLHNNSVIVVSNKNWHHGIIGIVSSRITERYYKPSAVLSINDDGSCKASGRSISGFNLFDALSYCSDLLTKFGGHELAAGFSLKSNNITSFSNKINEYAKNIMTDDIITPKLKIDAEIDAEDININLIHELKKLEPHGIGNRSPLFNISNATINTTRTHKSGKHIFFNLAKSGKCFDSPAFNLAEISSQYSSRDVINVVGTLNINTYRGVDSPQFIIRDIKSAESSKINVPTLRCIFICIKQLLDNGKDTFKIFELSDLLMNNFNCHLGSLRLKKALELFEEMHIIKANIKYDTVSISKDGNFNCKCDIESSKNYIAMSKY